jgi:hypothetical protein
VPEEFRRANTPTSNNKAEHHNCNAECNTHCYVASLFSSCYSGASVIDSYSTFVHALIRESFPGVYKVIKYNYDNHLCLIACKATEIDI